jgi:predicted transport protein
VPVDEYTIEHILPQNEKPSKDWQQALGPDWQRVQKTWLHTLGNLTLTGYNSEYSDRSFTEKRDMKGGFKESPLRLNQGLGTLDTWNEAEIQKRAARLADMATGVWSMPRLTPEVLRAYSSRSRELAGYTLDDHPQLAVGQPMRLLFEELRKEVLALDPGVTEEVLKLYIAYKAETNFVDVIPQVKRLVLSINLSFHELYDPKDMAKDVTNLGRWGNGDAEVALTTSDEMPYVMGLIRQAFEAQMGDGEVVT